MSDPSPKVRAQAALALSRLPKDQENVTALIEALKDQSKIVRGAAAKALGILGAPQAYGPLCQASTDRDSFVAKWSRWAILSVLGKADVVRFTLRGIKAEGVAKADDMTRYMQEGVLEVLISSGRFEPLSALDFTSEEDGDASEGEKGSSDSVSVALEGRVEKVEGDGGRARVRVSLKAVAPCGITLWEGLGQGVGERGAPPEPDEFADEYTIPEEPLDARLVAAKEASKSGALEFLKHLTSTGNFP